MSVNLIHEAGSANANSYCSIVEAESYFEFRLHKDVWGNSFADEKLAALVWATYLLDQQAAWSGIKATETQALRWPRRNVRDPEGVYISASIIPQWLKNATAEYAMHLLNDDITKSSLESNINRIKVGPIEMEYEPKTMPPRRPIPSSVSDMIQFYSGGTHRQRYLVRA